MKVGSTLSLVNRKSVLDRVFIIPFAIRYNQHYLSQGNNGDFVELCNIGLRSTLTWIHLLFNGKTFT